MGIWAELGVPPTADRATIRRAYAARLKAVSPDADPQGFARLRDAYEAALAAAAAPAPPPEPVAVEPAPPAPQAAPLPPPPDPLGDALRGGGPVAAADWLLAARPGLSLDAAMRATDRLGWTLATDPALDPTAVRDAADRLGWRGATETAGWAKPLQARLDAEAWLAALRRDAGSRTRFAGAPKALAARILLGGGRLRTLPSMGRDPTLRRRYGEFLLHAPLVGDAFDPARIDAVRALLGGKGTQPTSFILELFGGLLIAWAAGMGVAEVDPAAQDAATGIFAVGVVTLMVFRRRPNATVAPRIVRRAFWWSLGVCGTALFAAALSGLLVAPAEAPPTLLQRLRDAAAGLAVATGACLWLSRRLARRGRNAEALLAAVLPPLFGLLAAGSALLGR